MLTQEYTTVIDGESLVQQHPITYVNGLFQESHLNWTTLTKQHMQYLWQLGSCLSICQRLASPYKVKYYFQNLSLKYYIKCQSKELKYRTAYNITFKFMKGIKKTLADTLSRLIKY